MIDPIGLVPKKTFYISYSGSWLPSQQGREQTRLAGKQEPAVPWQDALCYAHWAYWAFIAARRDDVTLTTHGCDASAIGVAY